MTDFNMPPGVTVAMMERAFGMDLPESCPLQVGTTRDADGRLRPVRCGRFYTDDDGDLIVADDVVPFCGTLHALIGRRYDGRDDGWEIARHQADVAAWAFGVPLPDWAVDW